jgi:amidase
MGGFKEYDQYDGLGLAELVKKKEISAAEICEEAIVRIERVNPALNAVITPMYDLAREAVQNNGFCRRAPDNGIKSVKKLYPDTGQ